jgi:hypothetical protein
MAAGCRRAALRRRHQPGELSPPVTGHLYPSSGIRSRVCGCVGEPPSGGIVLPSVSNFMESTAQGREAAASYEGKCHRPDWQEAKPNPEWLAAKTIIRPNIAYIT